MFREFKKVRQEPGGHRRWFEAQDLELVLWLHADGTTLGFQLIYAGESGDRALTWRADQGFSHHGVDGGESRQTKMTPILVADGVVPWSEIETLFLAQAETLEDGIRELVTARLHERR